MTTPVVMSRSLFIFLAVQLLAATVLRGQEPLRLPATGWQAAGDSEGPMLPDALPVQVPLETQAAEGKPLDAIPPGVNFRELMRPTFSLMAEWQGAASDVSLETYRAVIQVPTYPIFGPPPPLLNGGFSYVHLSASDVFDLPSDLYDYSLGASWMRSINDRWMLRWMASVALATDGQNTTSDAWQFRGGLFATYRASEEWSWILGVLALGRNDIPVVPAVGAIWQPHRYVRCDLTFPRPRINLLLADQGLRQQWGYVGAGFEGGTWAYQRANGVDDQVTYRDWRLVLGWESSPTPEPGMPFARGRKLGGEFGYVFGREFSFSSAMPEVEVNDTFVVRVSGSF